MIHVQSSSELAQLIGTNEAIRRCAYLLDSRHEHADEHEDHAKDDEEFHEGEGTATQILENLIIHD